MHLSIGLSLFSMILFLKLWFAFNPVSHNMICFRWQRSWLILASRREARTICQQLWWSFLPSRLAKEEVSWNKGKFESGKIVDNNKYRDIPDGFQLVRYPFIASFLALQVTHCVCFPLELFRLLLFWLPQEPNRFYTVWMDTRANGWMDGCTSGGT